MPAPALPGFVGGVRQADDDNVRWSLQRSQERENEAQRIQALAGARHQDALTRLNDVQADVARRKQTMAEEGEKLYRDVLSKMVGGPPADGASPLDRFDAEAGKLISLANALMAKGDFDGAGKLITQARGYVQTKSQVAENAAQTVGHRIKAEMAATERVAQLLAGVKTKADYDAALMQWQSSPDILEALPVPEYMKTYNPQAVSAFVRNSKAALDQLEEKRRAAESAALVGQRNASAGAANARKAASEAAKTLTEERTTKLREGQNARGKTGAYPRVKKEDLNFVSSEISRMGGKMEPEHLNALATELAYEAELSVKQNPALNKTNLMRQFLEREKAAGNLVLPEKRSWFDPRSQEKGTYSRPHERAVAPPADVSQLKNDVPYLDDDGSVIMYKNGKKTVLEPASKPADKTGGGMFDDDDEE